MASQAYDKGSIPFHSLDVVLAQAASICSSSPASVMCVMFYFCSTLADSRLRSTDHLRLVLRSIGISIGLQGVLLSRRCVLMTGQGIGRAIQQYSREAFRYLVSRLFDRISCEMSIPSRRLRLRVAEQLADHG
jgi:hypothetical protein